MARNNQPEERLQMAVIQYLQMQYPSAKYCASLGGIRTSIKQAVKAKRTGYVKGKNDLDIYSARGGYFGLMIELKTEANYASLHQRQWIDSMIKEGYYAAVCKGFQQTKETIDWYMAQEPTKRGNEA